MTPQMYIDSLDCAVPTYLPNSKEQADLSLRWAHSYFVGFVMSRLNCRCDPMLEYALLWPHRK